MPQNAASDQGLHCLLLIKQFNFLGTTIGRIMESMECFNKYGKDYRDMMSEFLG